MLTPADIENPKRSSGYDHVGNNRGRWRAQVYGARKGQAKHSNGFAWWGPNRTDPAEAAQDYCNYINGHPERLPATLRSPGNRVPRDPIDDREVEAARGVLRDARAQRRKLAQGYVYLITDGTAVKVGYSVKPAARVSELQTGNPRKLRLLAAMKGTEEDEAAIHQRFMDHNIILEWFIPSEALYSVFGLTLEGKEAT